MNNLLTDNPSTDDQRDTQPKFFEAPTYFSEDLWLEKGRLFWAEIKALDKQGKALEEKQGSMNWVLGDWLLEGIENGVKPRKMKNHVLEVTGLKLSSGRLSNLMTVSRAVEPSRRREDLPYSIHAEVAKFDPETQEKLLQEAVDGGEEDKVALARWIKDKSVHRRLVPYSVRGFRAYIKKAQDRGQIPRTGKPRANDKEPIHQTISVRVSLRDGVWLENLARAKSVRSVSDMILTLAQRCVKEHREEFNAKIAEYKASPGRDEMDRQCRRIVPVQRRRHRSM